MKPILIAVMLLLAGCATVPPGQYQVNNSRIFVGSYDDVWTAVIDQFASNNIPIKTVEKDSGIIVAESLFVDYDTYCDCGKPDGLENFNTPLAVFNVFVRKQAERETLVTVNAKFTTTYIPVWESRTVQIECSSKGTFEPQMLDALGTYL